MLTCKIISLQNEKNFDSLESVILPTESGELEILPMHAETFLKLTAGNVILLGKDKLEKTSLNITYAICHIKDDQVIIIE